jgi:hypothetical protein
MGYQVQVRTATGEWVQAGRAAYGSRFDACEDGYTLGGDGQGNRCHPVHGYDTQDRTWRVVEVPSDGPKVTLSPPEVAS